jgi:hypothetical protein
LLPLLSIGQFGGDRAFYIGLKADVQSSGIANQNNYGQNEMDYGINPGVGVGGVFTYQLNTKHALLAEVSYQTGGQDYDDRFKGRHFMKDVQYHLLSIPIAFRHMLSKTVGYSGVGAESKPIWYILGGLQIDKIISPEIEWYLDGVETEFLDFVLEGSNPNQAQIESMGAPASDEQLFTDWDCMFLGAGGFQLFLNSALHMTIELRGGIGITDINAKPWRLKNNDGVYAASRNSFLGLHIGMHVQLTQ